MPVYTKWRFPYVSSDLAGKTLPHPGLSAYGVPMMPLPLDGVKRSVLAEQRYRRVEAPGSLRLSPSYLTRTVDGLLVWS